MRTFDADEFDLDEDLEGESGRAQNWRDIAMKATPMDLEPRFTPVSRKKLYPISTNGSPLIKRRAAVAATKMGLTRATWLRLLIVYAIHDQLGDDIDELLEDAPRIFRYDYAPTERVYDE